MKSRILPIASVVAIAFLASSSLGFAKVYTPAQFNKELKAKIGNKKGAAAYNAAANFLKSVLVDKKNKGKVVAFTNSVVSALKKPAVVTTALQGKAHATLANALTLGYFQGLKYNPMDSKFVAALKKLVTTLPLSQKTDRICALIAKPVLNFNTRKKGTASDVNFINNTIYTAAKVPPPPPVS